MCIKLSAIAQARASAHVACSNLFDVSSISKISIVTGNRVAKQHIFDFWTAPDVVHYQQALSVW